MRDIRSRESGASSSQTGISLLDVEGGNSPGYSAKNYAGKHAPNPMASVSGAALLGTLGIGSGAGSGAGAQQALGAHVERLALLLKRHLAGSNTSNAARAAVAVFGATLLVSLRVSFAVTFVLLACAGSFAFAAFLATWVLDKDEGSPEMRDISDAIRQGADGFFRVQYGLIGKLAGAAAGAIFLVYSFRRLTDAQVSAGVTRGSFALLTTVAFALGAGCSALSGYVGMWVSVRANVRVAGAARRSSREALLVALRAGGFAAILVVASATAGVASLYALFAWLYGVSSAEGGTNAAASASITSAAVTFPSSRLASRCLISATSSLCWSVCWVVCSMGLTSMNASQAL